jgi:HEAT repeat protein
MDRSLTKIVALLRGEDRTLQQAAAHVLGALGSTEAAVLKALGETLSRFDDEVRLASLSALEKLVGGAPLDCVLPLPGEAGDVGHRAMRVVSAEGAKVLPELKKRFADADELERRRILSVAGRVRGASGFDLILMALEAGHGDQVIALGQRLAGELSNIKGRERATLVARIEKYLTPAKKSNQLGRDAAAAAVDLLARVLGDEGREKLLILTQSRNLPEVRRAALVALRREGDERPLESAVLTKVLSYLKDRDYTHVVAPSIDLLENAKLEASHGNALLRCLEGNDPALRRFAVTALGEIDSPRTAKALIGVLEGDNPDLRDRAAQSLRRLGSAVSLLFAELCAAPDRESAWRLARILRPHAPNFKPDQIRKLAAAAIEWLEPGDARAEALVSVLGDRHAETLSVAAIKRARLLKKTREAGSILNLLRPLRREGDELPTEVRYEMALAELIMGRKDVVREVRLSNPGLRDLEILAQDREFDLLTRLRKEKDVLAADEFYLIGAHFAERAFGERVLGGDLLRWLIKIFPEEAAASSAASKLVMEGFPPPPEPQRRAAKEREIAKLAAAQERAERTALRAQEQEERELQKEAERAARAVEKAAARAAVAKKKKKAPAKKAPAPVVAKKAAKKVAAKKAPAKKAPAKKAPAKKVPVPKKKAAKKKAAKKVAKKKAAKKVAKKKVAKKKPARRR